MNGTGAVRHTSAAVPELNSFRGLSLLFICSHTHNGTDASTSPQTTATHHEKAGLSHALHCSFLTVQVYQAIVSGFKGIDTACQPRWVEVERFA